MAASSADSADKDQKLHFKEARKPVIPKLDFPLSIGENAKADGSFSIALGTGTAASGGSVDVGGQLFYSDGDIPSMPVEHLNEWVCYFKSDVLQLWWKHQQQYHSKPACVKIATWINRWLGETVFAVPVINKPLPTVTEEEIM